MKIIKKPFKKVNQITKKRKKAIISLLTLLFLLIGLISFLQNQRRIKIIEGLSEANTDKIELERKIRSMVKGYPIEPMVPYIIKQDPAVAAFLVSIAKKESNWGKRHPVLNGEDCFNYWGYRAKRERMGSGGHTCFDSPQEAVEVVAKRINYLIYETNRTTPEDMIYWKCGSSCAGHSNYGVNKWISDVDLYFQKLIK